MDSKQPATPTVAIDPTVTIDLEKLEQAYAKAFRPGNVRRGVRDSFAFRLLANALGLAPRPVIESGPQEAT